METQLIENHLVRDWLSEKRSKSTRDTYTYKFRIFLDYFGITPEDLLKLTPKQTKALALRFQNEQPEKPNNTILSHLASVSSFLDFHDKPIRWKKSRVKPRPDISSHIFNNGDLSRLFQVGDVRDKAILATATSLGWEISGFVELKKKNIVSLIERAKETSEDFAYFKNIRQKTGQLRLGILNPLALEWLGKWLKLSQNTKARKGNKINPYSDIFLLSNRGIQHRLKILTKRANLKTTGQVRFHNIRKWVMSGLSRSGFNEYQIKYVLGKAIPMSDQVYLQTLELEVRERYPSAYENCLNISTTISKDLKTKIEDENKKLKEKFSEMEKENVKTKEEMRKLTEKINSVLDKLENLGEK